MRKFQEIDHTADLAIKVEGNSLNELFLGALEGMYQLVFDKQFEINNIKDAPAKGEMKPLLMSAPSLEDLLVLWLSDMHYKTEVYRQIMTGYESLKIEEFKEYAQLEGRFLYTLMSDVGLEPVNEIKAVTYHQLEIKKKGNVFYTTIIFDV